MGLITLSNLIGWGPVILTHEPVVGNSPSNHTKHGHLPHCARSHNGNDRLKMEHRSPHASQGSLLHTTAPQECCWMNLSPSFVLREDMVPPNIACPVRSSPRPPTVRSYWFLGLCPLSPARIYSALFCVLARQRLTVPEEFESCQDSTGWLPPSDPCKSLFFFFPGSQFKMWS